VILLVRSKPSSSTGDFGRLITRDHVITPRSPKTFTEWKGPRLLKAFAAIHYCTGVLSLHELLLGRLHLQKSGERWLSGLMGDICFGWLERANVPFDHGRSAWGQAVRLKWAS
jgi:hypothetical protein